MNGSITIRQVMLQDTLALTELSQDAGWNQPPEEIRTVITRSGTAILGAFMDDRLLGTAAAYCYHDAGFAFVNEVLVNRDWRGRGIATCLLKELFSLKALEGLTLRLYATSMGKPVYEKLGFVPYGTLCFCDFLQGASRPSERVTHITEDNLSEIGDFDRRLFGANRERLLCDLFYEHQETAWCIRENGAVQGFIMKGPMSWLLQCRKREDIGELICHANWFNGTPYMACLWKEDAEAFASMLHCDVELTAMQYGTKALPPVKHHSGCLPDIG